MDVRFYPAAAGSSLPGDPSNLDFAQCLGYYNYNKVIIPACVDSSCCCRDRVPESRTLGSVGAGTLGAGGCPRDARPREAGGGERPRGREQRSGRAGGSASPPSCCRGSPRGDPPARPQPRPAAWYEAPTDPRVTSGCESLSPRPRNKRRFAQRAPWAARAGTCGTSSPGWGGCGRPGGSDRALVALGRPCEGGDESHPSALLFRMIPALLRPVSNSEGLYQTGGLSKVHQLLAREDNNRFGLTRIVREVAVSLPSIHTFSAACVVYRVNVTVRSNSHFPVATFFYKKYVLIIQG